MLEHSRSWKYYPAWVRVHQRDRFLLWVERPENEGLWTDPQGRVPSFDNMAELAVLAGLLGVSLAVHQPELINFDSVRAWLEKPAKQVPCNECLAVWNLFDDLASGTGAAFLGSRRGPVRNRVFDKLYDCAGFWRISLVQARQAKQWRKEERTKLRRVLEQGFRLWQKYVYRAPNPAA
ncbi:hypothetical protein [Hymenobacter sp. 15J16-1T3B]|uniref:hypothetical protein n=1 Tax=Hymenobacter sp. 15J16-1T3B TaxID=2886941 RepID=UPI001D116828|nr:hypothetical protein [Hymenobacter sp. 15J16-1T3B]